MGGAKVTQKPSSVLSAAISYSTTPMEGQITKEQLPTYMGQLKEIVSSLRGTDSENSIPGAFRGRDPGGGRWADGLVLVVEIPGTEIKGSGLIKVGPEGMRSERLTYYTKLSS